MSIISKIPPAFRQGPVLGPIFAAAGLALVTAVQLNDPANANLSSGHYSASQAIPPVAATTPNTPPNPAIIGISMDRYNRYMRVDDAPKRVDVDANPTVSDEQVVSRANSFTPIGDRLQGMGAITAAERETPRRNFLASWLTGNRPDNVCATAPGLNDNVRFRSIVSTLENLQDNGLTRAEFRFQKDCFNSLSMPASMQAYDNDLLGTLFGSPGFNTVMLHNFGRWQGEPAELPYNQQSQAYRQRYDDVSYLINSIRHAYGLEPVRVIFMPLSPDSLVRGLHYASFDGEPTIIINSGPQMQVMRDPLQAIATAAEEAFHSVDWSLSEMMVQGRIRPDDPRFQHAVYSRLNFVDGGYAPISVDPATGRDTPQSYYDYSHQYAERTAKDKAARVRGFAAELLAPPGSAPALVST